ncbi:MAG: carboxymuconolactone decarboxylase family protein [Burkholderiales bacterium]|jgi:alkylhydroperoxidase/carboxymuconolactone decarboxylase family protein YurZ
MDEPTATRVPTPVCDALRAAGEWNPAWDGLYALDPVYTERFLAMGTHAMRESGLDAKTRELIAIAVDASCTHLYAPGVRRHVRRALEVGATPREVLAVLEMVSVLGIHSVAMGVPMLEEAMADLDRRFPDG